MSILGLLFALVVVCAIWWAANKIMASFGLGQPVVGVVQVVIVILALLWLASLVGFGPGLRIR